MFYQIICDFFVQSYGDGYVYCSTISITASDEEYNSDNAVFETKSTIPFHLVIIRNAYFLEIIFFKKNSRPPSSTKPINLENNLLCFP